MKTSLAHLPENNQREILRIVEIIREVADPEKIILFGSYAKGTFTEHTYTGRDGIRYEYVSDYDLLVVTKEAQEKSYELEDKVVNRSRMYRSAVNMEIHDIAYINEGLEQGEYFFVDIIKDGITLHDTGKLHFASPRELTADERKIKAQRYFDNWFPQAAEFIHGTENFLQRESFELGAFMLHQATESLYYSTLLVFTDYKPKTHNLGKLRKQSKLISEELYHVFPAESSKKENHLFDLLKRGYVDARYRDDYVITKEELILLIDRVKEMQIIVERLCKEKIKSIQ
ncbi:MAG: HEPN domain-containing protein [Cyclobacteriaceae bacterium]|nr:HEPN domain-containing protein [Cyclobacteriaceae bacterium]